MVWIRAQLGREGIGIESADLNSSSSGRRREESERRQKRIKKGEQGAWEGQMMMLRRPGETTETLEKK